MPLCNLSPIALTGDPQTLEELFNVWKKEHTNRCNESCEEITFPKGSIDAKNFKDSFCEDGFTSISGKVPTNSIYENRPLFILKESNVSDKETKTIKENGKGFWFNEHPEQRGKYNRLPECLPYFGDDMHQIFGYMNLNKRGGFSGTCDARLKNYVCRYKNFIVRQIEIMNPSKIICCGCYDIFMTVCFDKKPWAANGRKVDYISVNGVEIPVYYIYHPAYSGFFKLWSGSLES